MCIYIYMYIYIHICSNMNICIYMKGGEVRWDKRGVREGGGVVAVVALEERQRCHHLPPCFRAPARVSE